MISRFARATGGPPPRHADRAEAGRSNPELIAPPTFCDVLTPGAKRPDIKLKFAGADLFAGHSIECLAPVRSGDTLEAKTRLRDVYAKTGRSGKMVFVVWETSFTNQNGETVALIQDSFVRRPRRER